MDKIKELKCISISFLGNINFDTRTYNLYKSLQSCGYIVKFNGFDWLTPGFESFENDGIQIEKLDKNRFSILFYFKFAIKLFIKLYKQHSDIYFAADFFSLPFCVIVGKLFKKKIFYDSREIFTELPSFENHPFRKLFLKIIERHYIKKVDLVFTTGQMDKIYIENMYKIKAIDVLRNLPLTQEIFEPINYEEKIECKNKLKLIYQGIIVKGRGIETYFKVLQKFNNCVLIILGGGEDIAYYKSLAAQMKINERVLFEGKISQNKLLKYTAGADIGLSIIDNISINNYYALPNKLFEYIMAGIPVIVNDLPQMKEIVENNKVGYIITDGNIEDFCNILNEIQNNKEKYFGLKQNCKKASEFLNWEKEFKKICFYFSEN